MDKVIHKSTSHYAAINYQMMQKSITSFGILMMNLSFLVVKMDMFTKLIGQNQVKLITQIHIIGKILPLSLGALRLWSSRCKRIKRKMKLKKRKNEECVLEESFLQKMKKKRSFGNPNLLERSCHTQLLKANKNS